MAIEDNLEENYLLIDGINDLFIEYGDYIDEELKLRIESSICDVIRYSLEDYTGKRITGYDLFNYDYMIEKWLECVREEMED